MFRNRKSKVGRIHSGQSTVEYIVLVGAVIAAVLIFLNSTDNNSFRGKIGTVYNKMTNTIGNKAEKIKGRQDAQKFNSAHSGSPQFNVLLNDGIRSVDELFE